MCLTTLPLMNPAGPLREVPGGPLGDVLGDVLRDVPGEVPGARSR
ncbi:hypothetical protein GCM10022419_100560 [Nonomuraea rosea]|uniref:Uncharacterized protein n=1 Tax=Nonomuraea rosea TaxID=638574 RepID=A0ABP6Z7M0_9ACTN